MANLLSVHKLYVDNVVCVVFYPDSFCIKEPCTGKILFQRKSESGLYKLKDSLSVESDKHIGSFLTGLILSVKTLFTYLSSKEINWYARLGHPSNVVLNKFAQRASIQCTIKSSLPKCIIFPLIRGHKLLFIASSHRLIKPFEIVFIDLWTSLVILVASAKCFLLLIDDFSKYM